MNPLTGKWAKDRTGPTEKLVPSSVLWSEGDGQLPWDAEGRGVQRAVCGSEPTSGKRLDNLTAEALQLKN